MMISNTVTFEQVEKLAAQLPPPEQLKLVTSLSEQLSALLRTLQPVDEELALQKREAAAAALLAELDTIAESIEGQFDSAEDIRQIREERANRL
jgi:hypothetical protein